MKSNARFATFAMVLVAAISLHAAAPLRARCTIGPSETAGRLRLSIEDGDCKPEQHCGSNFSNDSFSQFKGVSLSDLSHDGAQLTATLTAEAGTFTCSGLVHEGVLTGSSLFIPDEAFVDRMKQMGFPSVDSEKLQAYAFIGVESGYVRSLQQTGIKGITVDNLIALRIFRVDPAYIHSIISLGYELPDADRLIGLRVQGVDAAEVREIRLLGYQPSLDELLQIRIFHVTPDFIRRMEARGLKNLTIAKLVQIRIFNLAD